MAEFNLNPECLALIKIVAEKSGISEDDVVETAVSYFLKVFFTRYEMLPEVERVNNLYFQEDVAPEEIKKQLEDDKNTVEAAIAEAKRLGML